MSRFFHCILLPVFTSLLLVASSGGAQADESEAIASFRLRGGYDSNPVLLAEPSGSAFAGADAVAFLGKKSGDVSAALLLEASQTHYEDPEIDDMQRYRLRGQIEVDTASGLSLRSTSVASYFANYETRAFHLDHGLRLRRSEGSVQPFVGADLRYATLNETNAVLGVFLPSPQRFLRGSIVPGVAYVAGDVEIGASVNLSATRYQDRFDLFGFRRDNERVEPFLFASYAGDGWSAFASVSQLYGDWHDVDFSDVRRTMFEVTASYQRDGWEAEVSAVRYAQDTTFPISPISIDTDYGARLTRRIGDDARITAFARRLDREFLDSPFRSRQTSVGIEAVRELGLGFELAAEFAHIRMQPVVGGPLTSMVAVLSISRKLGSGPAERLRAGAMPPPGRPSR